MKTILALILIVAVLAFPALQSASQAFNPWGADCNIAEMYNWQNPTWNAACQMHIQSIMACCAAGGCTTYPCGG